MSSPGRDRPDAITEGEPVGDSGMPTEPEADPRLAFLLAALPGSPTPEPSPDTPAVPEPVVPEPVPQSSGPEPVVSEPVPQSSGPEPAPPRPAAAGSAAPEWPAAASAAPPPAAGRR